MRQSPNTGLLADDGSDFRFCSTCAFSRVCLSEGMDKESLRELHVLVAHEGPLTAGTRLFRRGEPFNAIAAVRTGTVKTCRVDRHGREQVLGFHLPGEIVGLSAIEKGRYPCDAIALDTVGLCRFSFPRIATLASRLPGLQQELFRLMSRDIGHAEQLAGDHPAGDRLAAFLVEIADRSGARAGRASRVVLAMPRTDIANYLRLAPETVSRLLRRFQEQELIRVSGRHVELRDRPGLERLGAAILRV